MINPKILFLLTRCNSNGDDWYLEKHWNFPRIKWFALRYDNIITETYADLDNLIENLPDDFCKMTFWIRGDQYYGKELEIINHLKKILNNYLQKMNLEILIAKHSWPNIFQQKRSWKVRIFTSVPSNNEPPYKDILKLKTSANKDYDVLFDKLWSFFLKVNKSIDPCFFAHQVSKVLHPIDMDLQNLQDRARHYNLNQFDPDLWKEIVEAYSEKFFRFELDNIENWFTEMIRELPENEKDEKNRVFKAKKDACLKILENLKIEKSEEIFIKLNRINPVHELVKYIGEIIDHMERKIKSPDNKIRLIGGNQNGDTFHHRGE